jgi:hypothetical protein
MEAPLLAGGSSWVTRPAPGAGHGLGRRALGQEWAPMSRTRSPDSGWHYVLVILFVALGVAVMHTDSGGFGGVGSHGHDAVATHGQAHPAPMATASTSPGPVEPTAPADPCHAVGGVCCLSALPASVPRQLLALMALAIAVVIGTTQVPLLQRALMAVQGLDHRHPPDLSVLCVLRT